MNRPARAFALLAAALAAACTDPAKGKEKAQVSEASSVPAAPAVAAETLPVRPPDSRIEFVGSKVTGRHEGRFRTFDGRIELAPRLEDSRLSLTIEVASMETDDDKLTAHLKTADFFDVERYPTAQFTTTRIEKGGTGGATHTVTGNLELHGVTKSISFPATIRLGPESLEAQSEFVLNRKDFGMTYPGAADDLIRDEVVIKLTVRAPRPKQG